MRVVFDSSVWIAALISSGTSKDAVAEALESCEVFISEYILGEVDRVLARKIGADLPERRRVQRWIRESAQAADPKPVDGLACRDPKDLPILWLALAVHADLLVTGDQDLLSLKDIRGIRIVPPAAFWQARP